LAGFGAVVAILAEGRAPEIRRRVYARALLLLAVLSTAVIVFREPVFDLLGKSPDASGRFYIWEKVFALLIEKPLEGWGWIGYWAPGIEPWEGLIEINGVPMYQAHNALLDVCLQLGVLGLALMLWLLIQGFIRLWRIAVRHTSPLYLYPLFIFLVITAQSVTESRLLIEISWVLLALVCIKSREGFGALEPMGTSTKYSKITRYFGKKLRKLNSLLRRI
jgi:O-antigen ligase